jgi:hypothetical protein
MSRRLTESERKQLSVIAVAPSSEISWLLRLIEDLTGEAITPADEIRVVHLPHDKVAILKV